MPDATKASDKDKGGSPPPGPAPEKVSAQEAAPAVDPALVHAFAAAMRVVQGDAPAKAGPPVATPGLDRAEPGGKYVVDGRPVNAWGKPFKAGQDPHADDPEAIPGG
jgi:hypothetical protein